MLNIMLSTRSNVKEDIVEPEVRLLTIFIALIGVALSFGACIFGGLILGPIGLLVLVVGAMARSRPAMAVGAVMMSGPLLYVGLALVQ